MFTRPFLDYIETASHLSALYKSPYALPSSQILSSNKSGTLPEQQPSLSHDQYGDDDCHARDDFYGNESESESYQEYDDEVDEYESDGFEDEYSYEDEYAEYDEDGDGDDYL
jgi:hypothetical protein